MEKRGFHTQSGFQRKGLRCCSASSRLLVGLWYTMPLSLLVAAAALFFSLSTSVSSASGVCPSGFTPFTKASGRTKCYKTITGQTGTMSFYECQGSCASRNGNAFLPCMEDAQEYGFISRMIQGHVHNRCHEHDEMDGCYSGPGNVFWVGLYQQLQRGVNRQPKQGWAWATTSCNSTLPILRKDRGEDSTPPPAGVEQADYYHVVESGGSITFVPDDYGCREESCAMATLYDASKSRDVNSKNRVHDSGCDNEITCVCELDPQNPGSGFYSAAFEGWLSGDGRSEKKGGMSGKDKEWEDVDWDEGGEGSCAGPKIARLIGAIAGIIGGSICGIICLCTVVGFGCAAHQQRKQREQMARQGLSMTTMTTTTGAGGGGASVMPAGGGDGGILSTSLGGGGGSGAAAAIGTVVASVPATTTKVAVTVPAGSGPGDAMQISTGMGTFQVIVPPGVGAGQVFHAEVPAAAAAPQVATAAAAVAYAPEAAPVVAALATDAPNNGQAIAVGKVVSSAEVDV